MDDRKQALMDLNRQLLELGDRMNLQSNYQKTLMLLAAIKAGLITCDDFVIKPDGWNLVMRPDEKDATADQAIELVEGDI